LANDIFVKSLYFYYFLYRILIDLEQRDFFQLTDRRFAISEPSLFWDQLLQFVAEGCAIPIIGQNLLTVEYEGREMLLYPLLAQRLAEYLGVSGKDLPQGGELNAIASRFITAGNAREEIYSALKTIMFKDEDLSIPEPLIQLAHLRSLKLFVTTTLDPLLERALNQVRFDAQRKTQVFSYTPDDIQDLPCGIKQLKGPVVYHLFGKLSAVPAYAVTQEDTLEFVHSLQSETHQPNLLFDELRHNNLIILGSSFDGWLARFFIRTAKCQRLLMDRNRTDYVADVKVSGDHNLVRFLRQFSNCTKIYQGSAVDFIKELYNRWLEQHPIEETEIAEKFQGGVTATEMEAGSVFLSYASEDRTAVEAIKDAFEAAGIDVFFDKEDLCAGDDFDAKIRRCISECSVFIPVISLHTLTSERRFFRIEWNLALEEALKVSANERFIMPVVIDNTSPTDYALPEGIRKLHWEALPNGQARPEFIAMVKNIFRNYQKFLGNAS
jgi:hypothetical protein